MSTKAERSQAAADCNGGIKQGIVLHHIATSIVEHVALNGKEMQLAVDKSDINASWDLMCESIRSRIGLDIQDGNWELERIIMPSGEQRPLH